MFSSLQSFAINGHEKDVLIDVLTLAYKMIEMKSPKCFKETPDYLVFSTGNPNDGSKAFENYPFLINPTTLAEHIYTWLQTANYPEQDDIDGSVYEGWEIFCPKWYGEDSIEPYDLFTELAVRPKWIYYGK